MWEQKFLLKLLSLYLFQLSFVTSKVAIVFYDEIHDCENYYTPDEYFEFYDLSTMRIILDEDDPTIAYLNGTWKFNVEVISPEKALVWSEKRHGMKWTTEMFYRRYKDACKDFRNPIDPAYVFFQGKKGCPHAKGEEITWNMHRISLPSTLLPSMMGEWRSNVAVEREMDGKLKKQCKYFRYDIYDE